MEKIGTAFRRAVPGFAETHQVPIVQFGKGDRKQDVMRSLSGRGKPRTGIAGVAAIGVAQEYQNVFAAIRARPCTGQRCGSPSTRPTGG